VRGLFTRPADALAGQASPNGVRQGRRLSNRGVILAGGLVVAFVTLIGWSSSGPSQKPHDDQQDDHGPSGITQADEVSGDKAAGLIARATPEPIPSAPVAVSMPLPTPPPAVATPTPDEEQKRLREAYYAALNARSGIQASGFQQAQRQPQMSPQQVAMIRKQDPNNAQDAVAAYQEDLSRAQGLIGPNGSNGGQEQPNPNDLALFNGNRNRWALNSTIQHPPTPYVLEPGWTIPAVLETAINSEVPGMITARVSRHVMDSPSGRFLLIPQGSMLVGEYASKVEYGQSRCFVAWQRINFPDGTWLDIGAMSGADEQGMSGLHDLTDTHFFRTFGQAILMSGITAGVALSQGPQQFSPYGQSQSFSGELSQSLGQSLGNAMSQLFQKNINVSPTLKIRQGFRLLVSVNKDLVFQHPYHLPNY
jgi:type IV secretory pathway VirB10-like protein